MKSIVRQVDYNDSHGYTIPRSFSRLKRLRKEMSTHYNRNFVKTGLQYSDILHPPSLVRYTARNYNVPKLAKEVMQGKYDFAGEERSLDGIIVDCAPRY